MEMHVKQIAISALAAMALGAIVTTQARATVVTFDDLPHVCCSFIPDGYGGIIWNGEWQSGPQSSPYNAESAPNVAVATVTNPEFDFSSPVTFNGAYFSGPDGFSTVEFDLYLGGTLESTSGSLSTNSIPAFLASGYSGLVDKVVVADSFAADVFAMDNVTYNELPEPSTMTLVSTALLGFVALLRRKFT